MKHFEPPSFYSCASIRQLACGSLSATRLDNWRVRWKKGVRTFTQKWTLSEMFQILHAVLFTGVKQCSACFFPEVCFFFEILRMRKTHFSKAILWGPFVERKTKEAFCFAKPWSQYNTWISYYCFVSTSGFRRWTVRIRVCFVVTSVRYEVKVGPIFFPVLFLYFFQNPRYLFIFVSF